MKLRILSPGNRMPVWVNAGYEDYARRFVAPYSLTLNALPAEKRTPTADIKKITEREGKKMLASLQSGHRIIALDERGELWSTQKLASILKEWSSMAPGIDFLIGGTDGLSKECLDRAHCRWSLSPLTLPHPLVRILLAEQLYRATALLRNHPYHRD